MLHITTIKNFYSLAKKNAVDCVENAKNVIISLIEEKSKYGDCYIPTIKEIKESVKLGLKNVENNIPTFKTLANDLFNRISVLVNPNYSSKSEKQKQRLELEMLELSVSPMPEIPEIPGEHKEVLEKIKRNDGKKFIFDCMEIDRLVAIGDNDGLKSYINTI
ncbi:MAG TPA: hypothetical protein DCF99_11890 [Flavobacteriaceae bacterium]|nr:hypothetical protein [Flavobacteriaceae bacterium]